MLLERDGEIRALEAALAAARAQSGRVVVVEGPPGIGKTSLLAAARDRAARDGFAVLSASGDELESAFPFGLAVTLLGPAVAAAGDRDALLAGPAILAAPLVAPGSDAVPATAGTPFARFHGLYWLCANLAARGPLLLCVDDAHWADDASVRWLRYLARRTQGLALLLLVATRVGEPGGAGDTLRHLASQDGASVLTPAPLSATGTARLVQDRLPAASTDGIARACHEASGGNPLFVHALLGELAAADLPADAGAAARIARLVPGTVARTVAGRLARLSAEATSLARAVAVLGDGATLRRAAGLAGLDLDAAARAADALCAAGTLSPGLPPRFAHPIVRAAIHEDLPAGERSILHRRAAQLLHEEEAPAEQVAEHLLACEPAGASWSVAPLRQAAERASGNGAPAAAIRYLRRALVEPPPASERIGLLLELGRAQIHAGDPAATATLRDAAARAGGTPGAVPALRELARSLTVFGALEEAADAYDRAAALAGDAQHDVRRQMHAELASVEVTVHGGARVAERLRTLDEASFGSGPGDRMLMAVTAFARSQANEPAGPNADLAARALEGWWSQALPPSASLCFYEGVMALLFADDYDLAERFLDEALADARARGSLSGFAMASWLRGWSRLRRGSIADAQAEARGVEESGGEDAGSPGPLVLAVLVETLVEQGALEDAVRALGEHAGGEMPAVAVFNPLLYARGLAAIARGQPRQGVADVCEAGRREAEVGNITPAAFPWRSTAAVCHAALGERRTARELCDEELELARACGAPRALGIALRAAGTVAGAGEGGLELLREAVTVLEGSPARLEHARALCELGAALRRSGSRRQAREPLRHALAIARECGALALGDRARDELVASGGRPRRAALRGRDALTPSELRVATMAAAGRSNREIAQDLFITVRTVEGHLSRAYAKLGIASRDQLARALDAAGES